MKKINLKPQIIPHQNDLSQSLQIDRQINKSKLKVIIKKPEIRLVYFGTPEFSALVLERLLQPDQKTPIHQLRDVQQPAQPTIVVQAVVTRQDKPVGRKQIMTPSPVAQTAQKYNIPTLKPQKLDEEFIKNHLSLLDSDLFIVAAYGKIIPQSILDIPKYGALNIHPSLLPKYRGPSPIQSAILNGDKTTGITIIKMDKQMDHGPIIYTKNISLLNTDNFQTLSTKMFQQVSDVLPAIIKDFISGKLKPVEQDHDKASYCHIIKKESGYFDIDNPPQPEQLDKMVRAYYPWPTAWTKWKDKIVKFLPGNLIQMEGKKPTKLADFLRGYYNFPNPLQLSQ